MDAAATTIFRSGKMRHLLEGSYCSRAATIQGVRALLAVYIILNSAKNMASQVDEAFCFDSVVRGQHVYKTVWTLLSGETWKLLQVFPLFLPLANSLLINSMHPESHLCCYTARHSQ